MAPKRLIPVYRNEAGDSAAAAFDPSAELPDPHTGRGMDVAYDLYDATGDLVKRGTTPREEIAVQRDS